MHDAPTDGAIHPAPDQDRHDSQCEAAAQWFQELRERLIATFTTIEDSALDTPAGALPAGRFERTAWTRPGGGGGEMAVMRGGRVLEKAGVNVSAVWGRFDPKVQGQIPGTAEDPRFWAAGVSVVVHPRSPRVPIAHMNTRMIVTTRRWFGGGADLTPVFPDADDTARFHDTFRAVCENHRVGDYDRFKAWCDEYFYLPHRSEARGVGGIFFDELGSGDWNADFAFVRDVGIAFAGTYPAIIRRHMSTPWTEADRQAQRLKRARYVEFNLLHDRGTRFGIMTGGNPEAVLMSLPPEAAWP